MNKTLKKTLSIILTVLMLVTAVPFAFAADSEKCADGHDYRYRFCRNCDEEMPDDYECVHQFHKYDICMICGYVDENSDVNIWKPYYDGYLNDFYMVRRQTLVGIYGFTEYFELTDNLREEVAKLNADLRALNVAELNDVIYSGATVGEAKPIIEEYLAKCNELHSGLSKCLAGEHNVEEYTSNGDATCLANGTKTGACTFCKEDYVTVEEENSIRPHETNDGDSFCDYCDVQITCEDCGRPVHEGQFYEYVCLLISLVRRLVAFVKLIAVI